MTALISTPLQPTTVVVIPTYNERENLVSLVEEVLALPAQPAVMVVDDNSPDGTGDLAEGLAHDHPGRVFVVHRMAKEGLGRAYVDGFQHAIARRTDLIAQMDADHSHRPVDLQKLIDAAIGSDADLVLGSRYVAGGATVGWPRHRLAISRFGGWYADKILGTPFPDMTGGFKVWKRTLLERIDLPTVRADGYGFQIETTWRAWNLDAEIVQVPVVFTDRVAGASKLSRSVVWEAALLVWKLRWRKLRHHPW